MLTTKRLSIIDDLVKNLSNEDDKWISLAIAIDLADEVLKVILPDNNVWENQLNRDSRNTGTLPDPLPLDTFKNKKQVSWFNIHPESTSARSAFKLFYSDDCALESNFFWFSESATKQKIAAATEYSQNWEDSELTRKPEYKVGIDFFLTPDTNSLMVVISNNQKLRVLELSGHLSNTQKLILKDKLNGAADYTGIENGKQLEFEPQRTIHTTLWNSLQIKEVNKKFYDGIAQSFEDLVSYLVKENGKGQEDAKQFSSRLLGRLLFVWFLRKMKIINESIGYFDLENQNSTNYYNNKLKLLFFNTLNTIKEKRIHFDSITPYLNGGLFEPKENDYFEEVVEFPELFFYKLFKHFDEFNFTTDESNSDFELIAVDPEMLGQVFESLLASQLDEEGVNERNKKGSFYTPREIVDYMCKDVLKKYLYRKIDNEKYHTGIDYLIDLSDNQFLNRKSTGQPDLWGKNSKEIEKKVVRALDEFKVLDPACGSGAFPMGMLQLLLKTYERLENKFDPYKYKIKIINNNIFGVDIEPMAVEIARLRAWLSVIVDELNLENIQPLPNLDFKFVCANSLVNLSMGSDIIWVDHELDIKLNKLKKEYFNARTPNSKIAIQKKYLELTNQESFEEDERSQQLRTFEPFKNSSSASFFDYVYMFGVEEGFDAVIGNPPYISTKKIGIKNKKIYEKEFGFSDDTYSLFFFKGAQLLKPDGQLSYITPKSFWTTKSKLNLRKFLYEYKINYIFDTANPFNSAMVDTCITSFSNTKLLENKIYFIDGKNNFSNPIKYEIDKKIYIESLNSVIFPPNERNLLINFKYKEIVNKLHDAWWDKINTSKKIESNSGVLTDYRNNLKEGNVTLLGCVTEGGVGLQTGNNGKYVAVRKDTINAINIIKSRPKKLETVVKKYSPKIKNYEKYRTSKEFLDSLDEKQISYLFDELKEKYGRDIFGKGYLYRIIEEDELVKVSQLTREERENGIDDYKNHYVPYDKGDKDGNRWYLETPYAISWKKSNVGLLRKDPRARYQGYNYYFREGFCWSDIKTTYLKCRIKNKGINDVKSMSLYAMTEKVPEYYIVSLINSEFMSLYVDSFVNNTQTFQINDARQIPVIVPNQRQLKEIKILYDNAINLKKKYFNRELLKEDMIDKVTLIEKKINHLVYEIYGIEE